jgi:hypothetical protein
METEMEKESSIMNKKILPGLIIFVLTALLTVLLWSPALGQDMMATATPAPQLPTAIVTPIADSATGVPMMQGTPGTTMYGGAMMAGGGMMGGMAGTTNGAAMAMDGSMSCPMMDSMGSMGSMSGSSMSGTMGMGGTVSGMPMAGGSVAAMPAAGVVTASGQVITATGPSFWNLNPWWMFGWALLGVFVIAVISGIVVGSIWLIRKSKPVSSPPPPAAS